ncbi:hypothetical protein F2P81_018505 [Scophthalmus maximus]|uniref:Uncharacterized protein n=1 Tax=Scophthalmus maximus TaxID=52904 RepID=A0A6A4SCC5_SCOMX|nr:hypothetical protein F2P81_018505 [Scophthalmus maximus]
MAVIDPGIRTPVLLPPPPFSLKDPSVDGNLRQSCPKHTAALVLANPDRTPCTGTASVVSLGVKMKYSDGGFGCVLMKGTAMVLIGMGVFSPSFLLHRHELLLSSYLVIIRYNQMMFPLCA